MKKRLNILAALRHLNNYRMILFLAAVTIVTALAFYPQWNPPEEMIGIWRTRGVATVRYSDGFLSYKFFKDTVNIEVRIAVDGTVTGFVGGAHFSNCTVQENRGWLGKLLNLATDYVIKGNITGAMFAADTLSVKTISAPFDIRHRKIKGSLFYSTGFDMYPAAPFDLEKAEAMQ